MGPKGPSGSTTTTQTQSNPAADAQLPYLQQNWANAATLADTTNPQSDYNKLWANNMGYAANQANTTAGLAGGIMPAAMQQYLSQIGRGMPAQNYASELANNAGAARTWGQLFGQNIEGIAKQAAGQAPGWQNQFMSAGQAANAGLQGYGSGALNALTGLAPSALSAGNPAQAGLNYNAAMALGNPALSGGLTGLASGRYIDPSTNPAYASMLQNATTPLINQYMTATAPQGFGTSGAELAGRYGSGAQTNAQGQAQYGLGQALSNTISGITNNAYNTGIQGTIGAGQALGGIYGQGISNATNALTNSGQLAQAGVQNAGNLINQGYTTGGNLANQGYNALNAFMGNAAQTGLGYLNAGISGLGAGANALQAGYGTANQALGAGGSLLNTGSDALSRALSQAGTFAGYPEQQYTAAYNDPWQPLSNMSSILGGAIGGSGTGTTSQPYFSNTGANVLGGITGALGIASKVAPLIAMI